MKDRAAYRYHPEHKVKENKLIHVGYGFNDCMFDRPHSQYCSIRVVVH